jgi:hypothetical protein
VPCPTFSAGDDLLRTISVAARFGAPLDVTLDEMRLELVYRADEQARRLVEGD